MYRYNTHTYVDLVIYIYVYIYVCMWVERVSFYFQDVDFWLGVFLEFRRVKPKTVWMSPETRPEHSFLRP